ncbi:MAG: hypothetical protein AAF914_01490 [Pseudomonadota bacterium]
MDAWLWVIGAAVLAVYFGWRRWRDREEIRAVRATQARHAARHRAQRQAEDKRRAADLADPPWRLPRSVASYDAHIYGALRQRLDLVEDRSQPVYDGLEEYYRDRETGQLWRHEFREPNMSQFNVLVPIDEIPPSVGD